jgi:hypothetical protein
VARTNSPGVATRTLVATRNGGSDLARYLLFAFLLAIAISPRVRFESDAISIPIDLRIQDLLIVPSLLYLAASVKPAVRSALTSVLGSALPLFLWLSALAATVASIDSPEVSIFRRLAYLGRSVEMFVLAAVIAALYIRAGDRALRTALGAVYLGAAMNFLWVLYQFITGFHGTALGSSVGDLIDSYGPKLIGEASAFGTGQYFAFIAAMGAAEVRAHGRRGAGVLLLAAGLIGATMAESRISMGIIAVIIVMTFAMSTARKRVLNAGGVFFGGLFVVCALLAFGDMLQGRLSWAHIHQSVDDRIYGIWSPLVTYVLDHPLTGVGPGGLTQDLPNAEAHNIVLRACLDFGIPAGLTFLALFVIVVVRANVASRLPGKDEELRLFSNFAMVSIIAVLVSGMVQDALTAVTSSHLAMISLALFAAVFAKERDRLRTSSPEASALQL